MGKNRGTKYLNHDNREDNFKDFFLFKERLGNFLYRGDTEKVKGQSHHSTQIFFYLKALPGPILNMLKQFFVIRPCSKQRHG